MYINSMLEENKNNYVSIWILLTIFLIILMIVIGGLTRLTDSGLSITKWDLFVGILPPLSVKSWEESFSLYQQIPEYKLMKSSMTLEEFKVIYWWEYIHRLLGRVVGIFFITPLIYYSIKKCLSKNNLILLYAVLFLIIFQGFLGWYMVESGLTEKTDVSQYRLAAHLSMAFLIIILLLWFYFNFNKNKFLLHGEKIPFFLPNVFLIIVFFQIVLGAFVSGLDAGKLYQTWPLMNGNYLPDDSRFVDLFSLQLFENPSLLQFLHRNIAYFIFIFFCIIFALVFTKKELFHYRKNIMIIFFFLLLQIFLGVITVVTGAQIILASLHQIGSIFLIISTLILVFKNSKIS